VSRRVPLPPEAYVHGIDGAVAVVPARVAAWMDARFHLGQVRQAVRGFDPEVDAALLGLHLAAMTWPASDHGSEQGKCAEVEPPCTWVGTRQAADRLNITERAVRQAIATKRLPAEQVDGRWRITRDDVEHYRAAQANRNRR
jgi:excisionase family DNA binding protein